MVWRKDNRSWKTKHRYHHYNYNYDYHHRRRGIGSVGKAIVAIFVIVAAIILITVLFGNRSGELHINATNLSKGAESLINSINPTINGTWATEFFTNVSTQRSSQYNYCPNLSNFAHVRFNTMVQNYAISHYGYDQDFQTYYGTVYNTYFGEEVFYLSGTTPSEQLQQIMTQAPVHWQELASHNYSYYGYYIGTGPTLEIVNYCSVTEIPGPNINTTQFFAEHGCTTEVTNEQWFVIEIASSCP
jgi:hypothetical protein